MNDIMTGGLHHEDEDGSPFAAHLQQTTASLAEETTRKPYFDPYARRMIYPRAKRFLVSGGIALFALGMAVAGVAYQVFHHDHSDTVNKQWVHHANDAIKDVLTLDQDTIEKEEAEMALHDIIQHLYAEVTHMTVAMQHMWAHQRLSNGLLALSEAEDVWAQLKGHVMGQRLPGTLDDSHVLYELPASIVFNSTTAIVQVHVPRITHVLDLHKIDLSFPFGFPSTGSHLQPKWLKDADRIALSVEGDVYFPIHSHTLASCYELTPEHFFCPFDHIKKNLNSHCLTALYQTEWRHAQQHCLFTPTPAGDWGLIVARSHSPYDEILAHPEKNAWIALAHIYTNVTMTLHTQCTHH